MTSSELSQRWAAHQAAAAASAAGGGISGDWRIIPKRKSNVLASMLDYHHHQAGQHNNHRVGLFQVNTNKNKTGNRLRLLRNPSAILSTVSYFFLHHTQKGNTVCKPVCRYHDSRNESTKYAYISNDKLVTR